MRITGAFGVAASRDAVWQVMHDPDTICAVSSSCEWARQDDETHYSGAIRARLGFISVRAEMSGEVLEERPDEWMRVHLQGEASGLPGDYEGIAELTLVSDANTTRGEYVFDMTILGRLGVLGRPFFQVAAQQLANSFAAKLGRHLQSEERAVLAGDTDTPPAE